MLTFTSESVCAGHPDKICDRISDAILDEALKIDKRARVAVETLVTKDYAVLAGEVTLKGKVDYEKIARRTIKKLGYTKKEFGFTDQSPITVRIHTQSPEISVGVDNEGAGDQGMMFGYACNETQCLMPLPIILAHRLAEKMDEAKKSALPYLRPDGKTQVTVGYESGKPKTVEQVVLACPHVENIANAQLEADLYEKVVIPVLAAHGYKIGRRQLVVNGTGVWHIGGPASDTGVTGRKIIVDTYGGMARVGGGCFSGKDPTKVDRSGAYAARYLAKNIVANKLAERCEVRLAYYIGAKKPVMLEAETFGTARKSDKVIAGFMEKLLDTSVKGIISQLDLRQPVYEESSCYGHFGRNGFPWEKIQVNN